VVHGRTLRVFDIRMMWVMVMSAFLVACGGAEVGFTHGPDDDLDQDGFTEREGDCNDLDSSVYPGAVDGDIEDGKDNDCDGSTDEVDSVFVDVDGDGYSEEEDCDDQDATLNPGQPDDQGDGIDNNCDGVTDEGYDWGDGIITAFSAGDADAELLRSDEVGVGVIGTFSIPDLDGDGLDELAIAVFDGALETTLYLLYGRAEGLPELTDLEKDADALFVGIASPNASGLTVVGGGDLDGDGFQDLLIGDGVHQRVSLYPGGERYAGVQDTGEAPAVFLPVSGSGYLVGYGLAIPGDLNGDGFDDLLIGQPGYQDLRGRTQLFLGGRAFEGTIDLAAADGSFLGTAPYQLSGLVVAGIGDSDGDGLADMVISGPCDQSLYDVIESRSREEVYAFLKDYTEGKLFVLYGTSDGLAGEHSLGTADATLEGEVFAEDGQISWGDLDGDGFPDLGLGLPIDARAKVLFGGERLSGVMALSAVSGLTVIGQELAFEAPEYAELVISPDDGGFGSAISLAGDLNGDGFPELVIAAPTPLIATYSSEEDSWMEASPGYLAVFSGGTRAELLKAGRSTGALLTGEDGVLEMVWPIAASGDFDGDGIDELMIGTQISPQLNTARAYWFNGVEF